MNFLNIKLIYLIFILILIFPVSVSACDGWPKSIGTKYSTICYAHEKGLRRFTKSIEKGTSFFSNGADKNPEQTVQKIDALVERVTGLLDMYPYDLRFNINIYENQKEVNSVYTQMTPLGVYGKIPVAFYSHRSRTIHVSLENINAGILAHEIAHAVINFYFPEPPPERMQEILAQYVDKHLWE